MSAHPMQPVIIAGDNVCRFKENKILTHLHRIGAFNIGALDAMGDFPIEDRVQFLQLLGVEVMEVLSKSYVMDDYARYYGPMFKEAERVIKEHNGDDK